MTTSPLPQSIRDQADALQQSLKAAGWHYVICAIDPDATNAHLGTRINSHGLMLLLMLLSEKHPESFNAVLLHIIDGMQEIQKTKQGEANGR